MKSKCMYLMIGRGKYYTYRIRVTLYDGKREGEGKYKILEYEINRKRAYCKWLKVPVPHDLAFKTVSSASSSKEVDTVSTTIVGLHGNLKNV